MDPWACIRWVSAIRFSHMSLIFSPDHMPYTTTDTSREFWTRATRKPSFWRYPAAHLLPRLLIHISQNKDTVKVTNLKNLPKLQTLGILKTTLHTMHLLKRCVNIKRIQWVFLRDTEQTRFCPQTDRRADEQCEASRPLSNWSGGIIIVRQAIIYRVFCLSYLRD